MPDPKLKHSATRDPTPNGDRAAAKLHADLVSLAHRRRSVATFYRDAFRLIAQWLRSPYASMSLRYAGTVIEDYWHTGPDDPAFWRPPVESLLTSVLSAGAAQMRRFRARHGGISVSLLSTPLLARDGTPIGAVAACVQVEDDAAAHRRYADLTSLVSLVSYLAVGVVKAHQERLERSRLDELLDWKAVADADGPRELAYRITNTLRNRLGCEQIALGILTHNRARILSLSGLDDVARWSPGVRSIRAAMEECFDHGDPIVSPQPNPADDQPRIQHRLHAQWSQSVGGSAVASIPFRLGRDHAVVVSLRARPGNAISAEVIEDITNTLTPVVTTMPLVQMARRTLPGHAIDAAHAQLRAFARPRGWGRRAVLLASLALAAWVMFGTTPYRLHVPCHIVSSTLQHVVAPFDGIVHAAYVAEGDLVTTGQLLYQLETDAMRLERRRLLAELEVARIEIDRALAGDNPAEAHLIAAQRRVVQARLAVIDDRLARAEAHAAFDGTVIAGDLRHLTGQSVARGDPLYLLSPAREWLVELEIPESAIDEVQRGQPGRFACDARPEQRTTCRIIRVLPRAQIRDGRNVFVAEARVDDPADWIRPGMEGTAQVDAGRRPVWWVATHRFVDLIRRTLWI